MNKKSKLNIKQKTKEQIIKPIFLSLIFLVLQFYLISCNLCPNNPSNGTIGGSDAIYLSFIPLNSNLSMIYRMNYSSFAFEQLVQNGSLYSTPAKNGNFAFIRIDSTDNKAVLMIGNLANSSINTIEKENKDFSIYYPQISSNGDKIAFLGGNNQILIWVNDLTNNSSYMDKISNNSFDNAIPHFSPDGTKLVFLENQGDSTINLKIIESDKPDNVLLQKQFNNVGLIDGIENYISFDATGSKIFFVTANDTNYFFNLMSIDGTSLRKIPINKKNFGIKIAQLSPLGNFVGITSSDGNFWTINIESDDLYFNKITNVSPCEQFIYFDWSASGDKVIAQKFNCEDKNNVSSDIYIIELTNQDKLLKNKNMFVISNNVQRAFWGN